MPNNSVPAGFIIYLILFVVSTVMGIIAYSNKNKKLESITTGTALVAGLVLAVTYFTLDSSSASGYYEYRVNGNVVSSGFIDFSYAIAIGITGGALCNVIGMGIGNLIYKNRKPKEKKEHKTVSSETKRKRRIIAISTILAIVGITVVTVLCCTAETRKYAKEGLDFIHFSHTSGYDYEYFDSSCDAYICEVGNKAGENVIIPGTYKNKPVVCVQYEAFEDVSHIKHLTFPGGIKSIEAQSYNDFSGLTTVTLPDSVILIGEGSFVGCSYLTSINIPDSVRTIGSRAFSGCTGLESITIPDTVTTIDDDAFFGVKKVVYNGNAEGAPWGAETIEKQ